MFSSELDWAQHGFSSRRRGIVVGTLLMLAVAASFVSARTLAFSYWFVVAGFLLFAVLDRSAPRWQARPGPAALALAAFFAFALISAAWAMRPELALSKAAIGLALVASVVLVVPLIHAGDPREPLAHERGRPHRRLRRPSLRPDRAAHAIKASRSGCSASWSWALTISIRPFSSRGRATTLIGIAPDDMTRNITSAALFLWPAAMLMNEARSKPWQSLSAVLLVLLTAAVVLLSQHESSKLALIVGLVRLRRLTRLAALGTARCRASAGSSPASPWLPPRCWRIASACKMPRGCRPRRDIASTSGISRPRRCSSPPFVGIGANMTYVLGPEIEDETPNFGSEPLQKTLSIHSHSIFMQTWLELGVVGAALLTLAGLSILGRHGIAGPRSAAVCLRHVCLGGRHGRIELRHVARLVHGCLRPMRAAVCSGGGRSASDEPPRRETSQCRIVDIALRIARVERGLVGRCQRRT